MSQASRPLISGARLDDSGADATRVYWASDEAVRARADDGGLGGGLGMYGDSRADVLMLL